MKKSILLLIFISFIFSGFGQPLFTYGKKSVSANEFLKAYNKNKIKTSDEEKAMKEYLDLYIIYKLKVQAAHDLQLDTLPSLQTDLQNFRNQIEENYLKDDKKLDALITEAFERSQHDIHIIDYYLEIPANADTASISKAGQKVYRHLKAGNKTAREIISDTKKSDGIDVTENDFGFITVFTLPYEFENMAYSLEPGEFSEPHRTKKGWHIFKNVEMRPALGKVKLAQILISIPAGSENEMEEGKKLADSLYQALEQGGDFALLAKEYSNDRTTYLNGGEIPEFGVAHYQPAFEKMAFSLSESHPLSKPFETNFGFHILKWIGSTPVPAKMDNETYLYALKQEVLKDSRFELTKEEFINSILPKTGSKTLKINFADLWKVTDSSLLSNKNIKAGTLDEHSALLEYNDGSVRKVSDWILYLRNSGKVIPENRIQSYENIWPQFVSYSAVENYRKRLTEFNPEFKAQLSEFNDGNMLFEIMERKVWGKAATDSAGILEYYNGNKEKYLWNASADAVIYTCANKELSISIIDKLKKAATPAEILAEYSSKVQADSGRFELTQIPNNTGASFTKGMITQPVTNSDGTVQFVTILQMYEAGLPRKFDDAKGLVINDYQIFLEQKWIEKLKNKYPVKVNEINFKSLL